MVSGLEQHLVKMISRLPMIHEACKLFCCAKMGGYTLLVLIRDAFMRVQGSGYQHALPALTIQTHLDKGIGLMVTSCMS